MISKQSLINRLALSLSKDECSDTQANDIVEFISSLNKTPYDDVKICKLQGVDFKNGVIVDFEKLFNSGEEHVYAVESYVAENMFKLLKKEKEFGEQKSNELFHVKNQINEEKNKLIMLFEEVGYTTVNRKALIWLGSNNNDYIQTLIHGDSRNAYSAFVDIRVNEDNCSMELFYPSRLHDSLMKELGLSENSQKPKGMRIIDVQVIPNAIPGFKDVADYDRQVELRKKHNLVIHDNDNALTI